jgi:hypothetical protein
MKTLDKDTLAMLTDEEREAIEAGDDKAEDSTEPVPLHSGSSPCPGSA